MSSLDVNWKPEFGVIYTWFAMDKNGKIAVFLNNCFGNIPRSLLELNDIENLLDRIANFIWEDSQEYIRFSDNKNGEMFLDFFSGWRYGEYTKDQFMTYLMEDYIDRKNYSDANIAINKGLFFFQALEGSQEGEDYPVGYSGHTKMGDYFRYLVPSIYANIHDIPKDLWCAIAASDNLDFTKDRLLDNDQINHYFKYRVDELYKV